MLTIFAMPKPFRGHIDVIQRNAIQSWRRLHPDIEVIVFGEEHGTSEVCREFGLRHETHVERNEFGTPLLNSLFGRAQVVAHYPWLAYVNCDILLMLDFRKALEQVAARFERFLVVGQRWDLDVTESLNFGEPDWEESLRGRTAQQAKQRPYEWIDYFAFHRGTYQDLPPMAIGRGFWDDWLVWRARASGLPVVDVSSVVLAVHQNHDYSHHPQGEKGVFEGSEYWQNCRLSGGRAHLFTVEDATHRLTRNGIRRHLLHWFVPTRRRCRPAVERLRSLGRVHLWHPLLDATRSLRHRLGLRREKVARVFAKRGVSRAEASGRESP